MSYIGQQLPADVFSGFTIDKFTGDGTANKALTLSKAPLGETALLVTIDGVVQEPTDDFTVSGTTVTLVGTAANGSEINVTHLSGTVPNTLASAVDVNGLSDGIILDADADTTISADSDDQIDFKTGGTDRLTIQSTSGNNVVVADGLTLTDGNITFSGSGHGIHLGVTSATASNLLDDYEEGTFTPTFNGTAGGASGVTYTYRLGWYEKIGNKVDVHIWLDCASMSSVPSGGCTITGLPFTSVNTTQFFHSVYVGYCNAWSADEAPQGGYLSVNSTLINLLTNDSADGRNNLNNTVTCSNAMSGNEEVMITASYRTE